MYCFAHALFGSTGARVGNRAGGGTAPSRRHAEVSEEARSSSAGGDTAAGRGTKESRPHERHDRQTAAEEQTIQATDRRSRKLTLRCRLFISFIRHSSPFHRDHFVIDIFDFRLFHLHPAYRFLLF